MWAVLEFGGCVVLLYKKAGVLLEVVAAGVGLWEGGF